MTRIRVRRLWQSCAFAAVAFGAPGCSADLVGGLGARYSYTIPMDFAPPAASVAQGKFVDVGVTLNNSSHRWDGTPQLATSGNPAGVTYGLSPLVTTDFVSRWTVRLSVSESVPPGDYPLVFTGSIDQPQPVLKVAVPTKVTYTLTVTAAPPASPSPTPTSSREGRPSLTQPY